MSQGKEHIDKLIQEKLQAAETTPPESVWNSIESSLLAKQRRAIIVLYRWLGSAAAILLLGFLSFYFIRSEQKIEPVPNKMAQEVIMDSIVIIDSLSDFKAEFIIIEEQQNVLAKTDRSLQDDKNKKSIHQNATEEVKAVFIAQNDVFKVSSKSRESISISVLDKQTQGELSSKFKSGFNALSLLKANGYKRMLENEAASILLAENNSSYSESKRSGWSVGLAFAPTSVERSSGIFTPKTESFYDMASNEMSFVSEKDIPAYSGGVNLVYQISERWSFQSGIFYLKQGQRIENFGVLQNEANASNSSNSFFGNITFDNYTLITDNAVAADYTEWSDAISYSNFNEDLLQQFELIEIPLIAHFKIINRKTIFSVMGGISPGILVGNNVYLENYSSNPVGETETVNSLIYKSVLGLNLEYPLTRKLYFNLSPTFKYQLNNFNKNAIVSENLRYLEFKTGLNYRF